MNYCSHTQVKPVLGMTLLTPTGKSHDNCRKPGTWLQCQNAAVRPVSPIQQNNTAMAFDGRLSSNILPLSRNSHPHNLRQMFRGCSPTNLLSQGLA